MIYLNAFLRVFKKFLKVVRAGKNGGKWGKMGVKSLSQNPHLYTTRVRDMPFLSYRDETIDLCVLPQIS